MAENLVCNLAVKWEAMRAERKAELLAAGWAAHWAVYSVQRSVDSKVFRWAVEKAGSWDDHWESRLAEWRAAKMGPSKVAR
jgi:hypothetical protein